MMADPNQDGTTSDAGTARGEPPVRAVVAALAGMAAAWLAAGSTGLLAPPLRHGLTWIALAVACVSVWPGRRPRKEHLLLAAALVVAAPLMAARWPVFNVLAVSLALAVLAWAADRATQRVLRIVASAALVLGVYRLALASIPAVWLMADGLGYSLGRLTSWISGKPLWVGATFGGLDFLVLTAAVYCGWLAATPRPRLARVLTAAAAVAAGHLAYLTLLSYYDALPRPPQVPEPRLYVPPPWSWSDAVRSLLPWNLPLVAAAMHLGVAAAMLRWTRWLPLSDAEAAPREGNEEPAGQSNVGRSLLWGSGALAVLVALVTTLSPGKRELTGKRIVACDQGNLNWDKPEHGRYGEAAAGRYGMLPEFVASLGGRLERSADLAEGDLDGADVLLLIHPVGNWPEDRLDRIARFVRGGGSLLVLAETWREERGGSSAYNEVLEHLFGGGVRVGFDTAASPTGNWEQAGVMATHPVAVGIDGRLGRSGIVLGPSIRARWPARPVVVGRFGWSDPGADAALTGFSRFDSGEKLGDLMLAAERRLGQGTVVVLSDASGFSNLGNVSAYQFTGRLLAYLAGRAASPQAAWRQALGLLGCVLLIAAVTWLADPARTAVAALALAVSLSGVRAVNRTSTRVLPDGREHDTHNPVAYVDASHLEAFGDDPLESDGVAGLALTLMRNNYLPLLAPDLRLDRLRRAGMLISTAPARAFSKTERAAVKTFVEEGGIFIATVGAERCGPIDALLEEFRLRVPYSPVGPADPAHEPEPMGSLPYLRAGQGGDDVLVTLYAAWPIEGPEGSVLARGEGNLPVIRWQKVGRGKAVLIGDTAFALNANLDYLEEHQNAHFWRWLITRLDGQDDWISPRGEGPAEETPSPKPKPDGGEPNSDRKSLIGKEAG
ncbi:MAG: hypothetical protein ACYTG0_18440 [Planctomycetota bacterium]|jgi:hypothetical protein